jgi:hypothetical protein
VEEHSKYRPEFTKDIYILSEEVPEVLIAFGFSKFS